MSRVDLSQRYEHCCSASDINNNADEILKYTNKYTNKHTLNNVFIIFSKLFSSTP